MCKDALELLSLSRLPGRLNVAQTAALLGFAEHDIPVLVRAKLLRPLGNPPAQAVKYFAAAEVERCSSDETWLNKATKAIYSHWAEQNRKRAREAKPVKTLPLAA